MTKQSGIKIEQIVVVVVGASVVVAVDVVVP